VESQAPNASPSASPRASLSSWARLRPDLWIRATEQAATLHHGAPPRVSEPSAPVREPLVRRLLDGALAAVWNARRRTLPPSPPLTPTRWIWRLVGYYHLTSSTPELLRLAAASFERDGRTALASWAKVRAREETGHDVLALRDLRAMGVEPERAVAALRPHPAEPLVAWFRAAATAADPLPCVGYAYVVERLAMGTSAEDIRDVEACLPAGARATRCMRVHSGVGSDADHVADTVAVVAGLSPSERAAIARAVFEAALVCTAPPTEDAPTDASIRARLHAAGACPPQSFGAG